MVDGCHIENRFLWYLSAMRFWGSIDSLHLQMAYLGVQVSCNIRLIFLVIYSRQMNTLSVFPLCVNYIVL